MARQPDSFAVVQSGCRYCALLLAQGKTIDVNGHGRMLTDMEDLGRRAAVQHGSFWPMGMVFECVSPTTDKCHDTMVPFPAPSLPGFEALFERWYT